MSSVRPYHVIVFGASGFTGQYIVEEIARTAEEEHIQWAVAGRNRNKLQAVLATASAITGNALSHIPQIIADVDKEESLMHMCKEGHVIINCVGPYTFYGEAVVKACVACACHYVDLSGEPQFIYSMQMKYNDEATQKGVYVVSSCGFSSAVMEMATLFASSATHENLNEIKVYTRFIPGAYGMKLNTGTLMSGLHTLANFIKFKEMENKLYPTKLCRILRLLPREWPVSYNKSLMSWCLRYGTDDASDCNMMRTHYYQQQNDNKLVPHVDLFIQTKTFIGLLFTIISLTMAAMFSFFSVTRWIISKNASLFTLGLFSTKGPSRKQVQTCSTWLDVISTSQSDQKVKCTHARIIAPEFAYATASIAICQCAYSMIHEIDKLPYRGGVLSPGIVFRGTNLIKRLQKRGLKFEIVKTQIFHK